MTEITDLSPTDSSNTEVTGESLDGSIANMGRMDNTLQAILGMFGRWTSSDTIASAATTDIGAQAEAYLTVSGTTTITSFGTVRTGTIRFLRFSGVLTLTNNSTSLILPGAANITTAAGDTAAFVSEGAGNWRCLQYSKASGLSAVSPDIRGQIYGLTLSNNVTDATNDIDIAVGSAVDSGGVVSMVLSSALGKQLDVAWAVGGTPGAPAGGRMSAAAIANTTYHVFLIRRPDTGVVDVGFDVSPTAPTLPTNYTQFRRIGSIMRVGGAIRLFTQDGDTFVYATSVTDRSSTSASAAVLLTLSVPTGIMVKPLIGTVLTIPDNANVNNNLGSAAAGTTTTNIHQLSAAGASALTSATASYFTTNTSAQLYFSCVITAGTITSNVLATFGYVDSRGK